MEDTEKERERESKSSFAMHVVEKATISNKLQNFAFYSY